MSFIKEKEIKYFYHVLTEKPMKLGQVIVFDENNQNGVAKRVQATLDYINGKKISEELQSLITIDVERWKKVAFRELALEKVRKNEFSNYPSRMACLYVSISLAEAEKWANWFIDAGRKVYSIVKLTTSGNIFQGDAMNCFDGVGDDSDLLKARNYWGNITKNINPVWETIIDGNITVIEIIKEFI